MKPRTALAVVFLAVFAAGPKPAGAERLVTSISRHQVQVNSSFTGTSIVLFGTIEPDSEDTPRRGVGYDVVVTVQGPKQTIVERRKQRVLGIWTNMAARTFVSVPSYLAVLSTQPFEKISDAESLRRLKIGFDNTLLPQQIGPDLGDVPLSDPFRVSFVRLKQQHGLYVQKTNGVTLLTPTVFRAEIALPAEAPIGSYNVEIKALADGALKSSGVSAFEITKVGFEQFVANAAREHGLLYGLTTAMMAVLTGWFASVVFRRD